MRTRGTGTMTERSPGTWRLRVVVREPTGKLRQVSRTVHTDKRGGKRAAAAELRRFAQEVREGKLHTQGAGSTLRAVSEQWLALLEARGKSPATIDTYRSHLNNHILPALGETDVALVDARSLDALYGRLPLAPSTVRIVHATVMACLRQAMRWGLIEGLPGATPPTVRRTERDSLTPADVEALVRTAKEHNLDTVAMLITLAAVTGLRRGELCGLRVEDLDWDTSVLRVRRQIRPQHGVGEPKAGSTRTVAIGPRTAELLQAYLATERERWSAEPGPWLFSDDGENPLYPPRVSEAIGRVARWAGISATTHGLRHFHSTYGVAGGVDLVTMAKRAGHTVDVATRVYMHQVHENDRAAAEVIERALGV